MELVTAMQDHLAGGGEHGQEWTEAVSALIRLLNPMAPRIGEELWQRTWGTGMCADAAWPEYDAAAAAEPEVMLVVQIGGRVRDRLRVPAGLDEAPAEVAGGAALGGVPPGAGRRPLGAIYVPDILINLVP